MDETTDQLIFTRQLGGAEDLLFGFGATNQIREGENVIVSFINSGTIPYDSTRSIKQALDELFLAVAVGA